MPKSIVSVPALNDKIPKYSVHTKKKIDITTYKILYPFFNDILYLGSSFTSILLFCFIFYLHSSLQIGILQTHKLLKIIMLNYIFYCFFCSFRKHEKIYNPQNKNYNQIHHNSHYSSPPLNPLQTIERALLLPIPEQIMMK